MKKIKIVGICGKSGSGKDTLLRGISAGDSPYHKIISCTTRPPRIGEKDGVDYHFLSHDDFAEQMNNGKMLEVAIFRDWCYGTSLNSLDPEAVNIGVFNLTGIANLLDYDFIDLLPIYVTASDKQRMLRQLNREYLPDVAEIVRRYTTDEEDFAELSLSGSGRATLLGYEDTPFYVLTNETREDFDECINDIKKIIGQKWENGDS